MFGNCGHQGTKRRKEKVVGADIERKKCVQEATAAQQRGRLEESLQRVISNIDEVGRLEHKNERE